ncbi:DUF1302 domain-containing protein [Acidovorax sp.]|uniref:DUF1302 domain-containing protein n=1 Tax=Acidovorax sp. TaxID=1872122 RepID=UPI003D003CE9
MKPRRHYACTAGLIALTIPAVNALAQEERKGSEAATHDQRSLTASNGWTVDSKNTLTLGVGIRTKGQKSSLVAGGKNNSDDGNLNYAAGDEFGRVAKLTSHLKAAHEGGIGIALGATAWYDDNLLNHAVPHGNNPNSYTPNSPLSDRGFDSNAKFQGLTVLNAHLFGQAALQAGKVDWKLGLISIERERGFSFSGGLRDIETRNQAASSRPGAQPDEGIMPVWGATARWALSPELRIEGFLQFKPQQNIERGCGTYFANDYTAPGCDRVFYSSARSEQQNVRAGIFTPRSDDITPDGRLDQAGMGISYLAKAIGTRFGAFFAQYHSRTGYTDVRKGQALGPAGGSTYAIEFPEDKQLLALTSATRFPQAQLLWLNELSLGLNQPVQLNNSDLQEAFLTGRGFLGRDAVAAPAGSLYRGFDRFKVLQLQTGLQKEFSGVLGANRAFLAAEVGLKHVVNLPDVSVRRYGRPENSDSCQSAAECATSDGFVTSNAWGYRIRGGLEYSAVGQSALRLRPSVQFAHDVRGWAYDYSFIKGRKSLSLELDAEYAKDWFGTLSYALSRGGQFNTRKDRDYAMVSVGYRF